jgi:hypothetical protein
MEYKLTNINIEELVKKALTNPRAAINIYLMTSYLYYNRYVSAISDNNFDSICKYLYDHFDSVEHQHKHLLSKCDLKAGTGFAIKEEDYPMMVKQAAFLLERQLGKEENEEVWSNR